MTTIRKLAELAGVSTATVMRVMHNNPHVAPETRDRILELAALYTYHPRVQPADTEETNLIGCIIPRITSITFSHFFQGVMETAFTESYRVIALETKNQVTHTCRALDVLAEHRVQGVIIAPGHVDLVPIAYLYRLWSQGIHVVVADEVTFDGAHQVDMVLNDHREEARIGLGYLYDLGHREIAYVGPLSRAVDGKPTREKEHYLKVFRELKLSTEWLMDNMRATPANIVDTLIALPHPPTAIMATSDLVAVDLINALRERGWAVPGRISVLGRGNHFYTELLHPKLTSIETGMSQVGAKAAEMLFRRIASGEKPAVYAKERTLCPCKLVVRESCGHPHV
jgi:DNA-binding LacI/PurR family transcriptional regulator